MTKLQLLEMTPEQRLKQAEILLATAAKAINQNTESIEQINLRMLELTSMFSELTSIIRHNDQHIRQNQEEIKRIWEYLLSQREENGHAS
jgi:hypothetical protein